MKFPIKIISSQSYLQKIHSSEEEKNLLWIKFSMQTFTQGAVCPLLGILILKYTLLMETIHKTSQEGVGRSQQIDNILMRKDRQSMLCSKGKGGHQSMEFFVSLKVRLDGEIDKQKNAPYSAVKLMNVQLYSHRWYLSWKGQFLFICLLPARASFGSRIIAPV